MRAGEGACEEKGHRHGVLALVDVATACVSVSDVQDRRVRTAGSRGTTA